MIDGETTGRRPPVSGRSPGPGRTTDLPPTDRTSKKGRGAPLDPDFGSQGRPEGAQGQPRIPENGAIGLAGISRTLFCGSWSCLKEGLQAESIRAVVVGHFGRADPPGSADRVEFGQGFIEFVRGGSPGQEEIELFLPKRNAFAEQGDSFDRGAGRAGLECPAQQAEEDAFVLTGRGHADPSSLFHAVSELEVEAQFPTAEGTEGEAFREARDQAAEHEGKGFEAFDRGFEIDALLESIDPGFGEGHFPLFSAGPGDQAEEIRTQTCREITAGKSKQVPDAMETEAGECLGGPVIGIEQIDGEGREEAGLVLGKQDPRRLERGFP